MSNTVFSLSPVGVVHSCFKEKFGVPRQPGLASEARAELELLPPYNRPEWVEGLEAASHIWIQFIFHLAPVKSKAKVRPPRLGGNQRCGVFATRSPVRPNRLGMSVVKLEGISAEEGVKLHLSGVDLVDQTPVVDIKPYIPYVDSVPKAKHEFAGEAPSLLAVFFSDFASGRLAEFDDDSAVLKRLIEQVLQQDPRPSYQEVDESRLYGMNLLDYDVIWQYREDDDEISIEVQDLIPL